MIVNRTKVESKSYHLELFEPADGRTLNIKCTESVYYLKAGIRATEIILF